MDRRHQRHQARLVFVRPEDQGAGFGNRGAGGGQAGRGVVEHRLLPAFDRLVVGRAGDTPGRQFGLGKLAVGRTRRDQHFVYAFGSQYFLELGQPAGARNRMDFGVGEFDAGAETRDLLKSAFDRAVASEPAGDIGFGHALDRRSLELGEDAITGAHLAVLRSRKLAMCSPGRLGVLATVLLRLSMPRGRGCSSGSRSRR